MVYMNAKKLIQIAKNKGYIKTRNYFFGEHLFIDNEKLCRKIIEEVERDDDLIIVLGAGYSRTIFSCEKFYAYCKANAKKAERLFIPDEFYEHTFPKQRNEAIKMFNKKYGNEFFIKNGSIQNRIEQRKRKAKQDEINDFVMSLK